MLYIWLEPLAFQLWQSSLASYYEDTYDEHVLDPRHVAAMSPRLPDAVAWSE
jgi:hypothetical protein